jgi:hypothetical protein
MITYHVFSSHTFNDLPCLPRLWFILCFSPRISNNLWCLRRVWFIPYFTKKSYCLASLTRLWFIWIVPWFFFSLLMFIFDNEWYFAGLVLPWVLCNLHLCTFILYVRRVPLQEYLFDLGTLCLYHSLTILLLKLSRIKPAFCFIARWTGYNVMLLKFVSVLRQVSGFLRVL